MTILGIDPGYGIVGWGVVDYHQNRFTTLGYGAITTPSDMDFNERLKVIYDDLKSIITRFSPATAAVEKLYFQNNQKTAINVAEARGVILLALQTSGVTIGEYTPLQVKSAVVGYGKAEKKQVQEMTKRILNLNEIPKPDDTADALALAIAHAHSCGYNLAHKGAL
jgi:crossover junction endodeoxyribonuclease RuvC